MQQFVEPKHRSKKSNESLDGNDAILKAQERFRSINRKTPNMAVDSMKLIKKPKKQNLATLFPDTTPLLEESEDYSAEFDSLDQTLSSVSQSQMSQSHGLVDFNEESDEDFLSSDEEVPEEELALGKDNNLPEVSEEIIPEEKEPEENVFKKMFSKKSGKDVPTLIPKDSMAHLKKKNYRPFVKLPETQGVKLTELNETQKKLKQVVLQEELSPADRKAQEERVEAELKRLEDIEYLDGLQEF